MPEKFPKPADPNGVLEKFQCSPVENAVDVLRRMQVEDRSRKHQVAAFKMAAEMMESMMDLIICQQRLIEAAYDIGGDDAEA